MCRMRSCAKRVGKVDWYGTTIFPRSVACELRARCRVHVRLVQTACRHGWRHRRQMLRRARRVTESIDSSERTAPFVGRSRGRHHAFPTFDFFLLHLHGAVRAVEFVVEPTRIADGMTSFVAPPQRCDRGAAVLTRDHDTRGGRPRRVVVVYQRVRVTRMRFVGTGARLSQCHLRRFRYAVVVRRASVAHIVATGAVASSPTGTCSVHVSIRRYIGRATL